MALHLITATIKKVKYTNARTNINPLLLFHLKLLFKHLPCHYTHYTHYTRSLLNIEHIILKNSCHGTETNCANLLHYMRLVSENYNRIADHA